MIMLGKVVILHFTGVENPLCIECLEEMEGQIHELEKLAKSSDNVSIITINIRKNPYSISGCEMAVNDFGANISWHWVEDFSPYPYCRVVSKVLDCRWSVFQSVPCPHRYKSKYCRSLPCVLYGKGVN